MGFTNPINRNSGSFTNPSKNSSGAFTKLFRHGKVLTLGDLANLTFTDTVFDGDPEALKDKTFEELNGASWSNLPKS